MDTFTQYIDLISNYVTTPVVVMALALGLGINFLMTLSLVSRSRRVPVSHSPVNVADTQQIFEAVQSQIREIDKKIALHKQQINSIERTLPHSAMVRYNPFRDSGVGGNQSFSLASVDKSGNGSIITHLFSREMSRVSAKEIVEWTSQTALSPEEKEVLKKLKNS